MGTMYNNVKPFVAVIFLQIGFAGMDILAKVAFNKGMSNYVFVVYRHAVATIVMAPFALFLEKTTRPKMTYSIFVKILILSILEPVIDNNLFFLGMKQTTATLAVALINIVPGITFVMACILRIEKIKIKSINSQAKIIGTLTTLAGAMLMTLVKGPVFELHKKNESIGDSTSSELSIQDTIKGSLMVLVGCLSGAAFIILQAITLKTYPSALSLTVWICLFGTVGGAVVALVMERESSSVWSLAWDTRLLSVLYSGLITTGLSYYIQGVIMKVRGPVFVTAFSPLSMVIVAIMSFFILSEKLFLGRICGAIVIVVGLYLVIWGKRKDYKSETLLVEENDAAPSKEMLDRSHNKGETSYGEIVINISKEGIQTFEKQECGKVGHYEDNVSNNKIMTITSTYEGTVTLEKQEFDQEKH